MKIEATKSDWYIIFLFFAIGIPITLNGYYYNKGFTVPVLDTVVYFVATLGLSYIIVYRLFPIFFPKKQILKLFFWTILLMILFGFIELVCYRLIEGRSIKEFFQFNALFWSIISSSENSGILIGMLLGKKFYDAQIEIQKKEKQMRESELRRLKAQVDPHFLFNNLNTVDALIDADPKIAKSYLKHLSELYRYLIRTKDDEVVELSDEMEFAQNYIYLIEKRFGDAFQFVIETPKVISDYLVPPGALQTVLENVVKHNSGSVGSPIKTNIVVENDLVNVTNNKNSNSTNQISTGTGLNNLKARYALLTELEVQITDKESYTISLPILKSVD